MNDLNAGAVPDHDPTERSAPVLEAISLTKHFPVRRGGFTWPRTGSRRVVHAVDDVSLQLYEGQISALVGESGSGKSTLARVLAQLDVQTSGELRLRGRPVKVRHSRSFRRYARAVQIVFQDPFGSLNPTRRVRHHLRRPLKIHRRASGRKEVSGAVSRLLEEVSLSPPEQYVVKFPHELSGGQRQRVAVARSLASQPVVLLADEPVSMLDVSIRLGILNLLGSLVEHRRLALLYITHDIASARYFATDIMVMYAGELVEGGTSEEVTQRSAHPYTQLLLSCAPDPERLDSGIAEMTDEAGDEPASLIDPPTGCRFHPRCPHRMAICSEKEPVRADLGPTHWVRCWLHSGASAETRDAPEIAVEQVVGD